MQPRTPGSVPARQLNSISRESVLHQADERALGDSVILKDSKQYSAHVSSPRAAQLEAIFPYQTEHTPSARGCQGEERLVRRNGTVDPPPLKDIARPPRPCGHGAGHPPASLIVRRPSSPYALP